ncbi:MAG TPA: helix-turn-helix domain-containing protein [Terracidiphilus sp.]
MDQHLQLLWSYQKQEMSVADLCREYGMSRPTGYRWINRYNETGPETSPPRDTSQHFCLRHSPELQQLQLCPETWAEPNHASRHLQ